MNAEPAHPDRPSTWVRFRPTLCTGCRAGCCHLPVEVTLTDLVRLELVAADEGPGSAHGGALKKLARRLEREGVVASFRARTGLFTLRQKPSASGQGGPCVFLGKDSRCTVYDRRPEVCRRFPEIGPRPGFCPASSR